MEEQKKPHFEKAEQTETLVRILGSDIPGSKHIEVALTRIKGVSWTIARFICLKMGIDKRKKVAEFSKEDIKKIEDFIRSPDLPEFLMNRRSDPETGESKHLSTIALDLQRDFDIKKLRRIKAYRGIRHALGLPVRGQRTRAHFRKRGLAVGVKRRTTAKSK